MRGEVMPQRETNPRKAYLPQASGHKASDKAHLDHLTLQSVRETLLLLLAVWGP